MDAAEGYEKMFHETIEQGVATMREQAGRYASMSQFVDDGVRAVPAFDLSGSSNSRVTLTERDFARFAFFAALGASTLKRVGVENVGAVLPADVVDAENGPKIQVGTRVYHRRADGFGVVKSMLNENGDVATTAVTHAVVAYEWPWEPGSTSIVPLSELCFDFDAPTGG